jgi:hypothetical protein
VLGERMTANPGAYDDNARSTYERAVFHLTNKWSALNQRENMAMLQQVGTFGYDYSDWVSIPVRYYFDHPQYTRDEAEAYVRAQGETIDSIEQSDAHWVVRVNQECDNWDHGADWGSAVEDGMSTTYKYTAHCTREPDHVRVPSTLRRGKRIRTRSSQRGGKPTQAFGSAPYGGRFGGVSVPNLDAWTKVHGKYGPTYAFRNVDFTGDGVDLDSAQINQTEDGRFVAFIHFVADGKAYRRYLTHRGEIVPNPPHKRGYAASPEEAVTWVQRYAESGGAGVAIRGAFGRAPHGGRFGAEDEIKDNAAAAGAVLMLGLGFLAYQWMKG